MFVAVASLRSQSFLLGRQLRWFQSSFSKAEDAPPFSITSAATERRPRPARDFRGGRRPRRDNSDGGARPSVRVVPDAKGIVLQPNREKPVLQHHHWIFSGAVRFIPQCQDGDLLPVVSSEDRLLGHAFVSTKGSILGRMVSFGQEEPLKAIEASIHDACQLRRTLFADNSTNAFRLVNGEGDRLPGLVIDRYGDWLVFQVSTRGMARLLNNGWLAPTVLKHWPEAKGAYLRPRTFQRGEADVEEEEEGEVIRQEVIKEEWIAGEAGPDEVEIFENGCRYVVDLKRGQKTGFFIDQREMRALVGDMSKGKRVLNCFSYSGGFAIAALKGGAKSAASIDESDAALALAKRNTELNDFPEVSHELLCRDVFAFLREAEQPLPYEVVVLDPPAFCKRKSEVIAACKGYKEINKQAMIKALPGTILVTCSCSYHVNPVLFQQVVFQAAEEAGRKVSVISRHRQAPDHVMNLFHPEQEYLKSLVLYLH